MPPIDLPRALAAARHAWATEQYDAALTQYRDLCRRVPGNLALAIETAWHLGQRYEPDDAAALLDAAAATLVPTALQWTQIGEAFAAGYRSSRAEACYRRALGLEPACIPARIALAAWLDRRHRVDEAVDLLTNPPSPNAPGNAELAVLRGKLLRRLGRPDEAIAALRPIAESSSAEAATRAEAWYALADQHDRSGDAQVAMDAAARAKQLLRPSAQAWELRAKAMFAAERSFATTVDRGDFERWQADAPPIAPAVALLTGPPRSGTTLLERSLASSGTVITGDEFDVYPVYAHKAMLRGMKGASARDVLNSLPASQLTNARSLYWRYTRAALGPDAARLDAGLAYVDKNPSLTMLSVPFRRLLPRATIIMALRDPRDVVVSCYLRDLPLNHVSVSFLDLATTAARVRAELEAWCIIRERLPGAWLESRYESMVADAPGETRRVLAALGVTAEVSVDHRAMDPVRPVRSPTYEALTRPIHSDAIGRWRRYERWVTPLESILRPVMERLGYAW